MAREKPLKNAARSVDAVANRIYVLTTNPGELGKFITATIAATDKQPGEFGKWLYPEVKAFMAAAKADSESSPVDESLDVMDVVKAIVGVLVR